MKMACLLVIINRSLQVPPSSSRAELHQAAAHQCSHSTSKLASKPYPIVIVAEFEFLIILQVMGDKGKAVKLLLDPKMWRQSCVISWASSLETSSAEYST
jgi:hypothetical protein